MLQWNNRATQGNPYDYCPQRDVVTPYVWGVAITYMFPVGTAAGGGGSPYTTDYGFYPMNTGVRSTSGMGCNTGGNTIFNTGTYATTDRQYLYYSTDPAVDIYWARPRCYLVNGSEPSISEIISSEHNVWMDATGSPTNMYAFNNPVLTRDTKGGYFDFNGSNTYFQGRNNTAMDNQTLTIQAWVNTDATTQNGFIFEKGSVNTQYALFQEGDNMIFRTCNTSASTSSLTFPTASYMSTGTWHMVTATYDGSNKRLYVDTTQRASGAYTETLAANTWGCGIGRHSSGYYFNGKIASVRVYGKALSVAEIKNTFNSQRNRFGV
jgi:hypothetical protein